jgi:Peptidase family S41
MIRAWLIVCFVLILGTVPKAEEQRFTPEQMKADLAFMLETFEAVHPNLYAKLPRTDTKYLQKDLENQLNEPMTFEKFGRLLQAFADRFQDGHTLLPDPGFTLRAQTATQAESPDSYKFSIPSFGIGLIDFRAFANPERFQKFLETTFTEIQRQKLTTLIVDLRNNGGGNSALGNTLLNYLTDKPFRQFSRAEVKVSPQFEAYLKARGSELPWPSGSPIGSIVKVEIPFVLPTPQPLRFAGKLYVLIDGPTFSSASAFASVIKDFKLGVLVGAETSGHPTDFGNIYPFKLPNSNLEAWVSSTYWVRPSGQDDGRGVIPDVETRPDRALDWVLRNTQP